MLLQMLFLVPWEIHEIYQPKCLHHDCCLRKKLLLVCKRSFHVADAKYSKVKLIVIKMNIGYNSDQTFIIHQNNFSYTYFWYNLHIGSLFWIMCATSCCYLESWWLWVRLEYYHFTFLAVSKANFSFIFSHG